MQRAIFVCFSRLGVTAYKFRDCKDSSFSDCSLLPDGFILRSAAFLSLLMSVAPLTHTPTGKVGTGVGGTIRHMETYNIVTYGNTDTKDGGA